MAGCWVAVCAAEQGAGASTLALNLAATAAMRDTTAVAVHLAHAEPLDNMLGEDLNLARPDTWGALDTHARLAWLQERAAWRDLLLADLGSGGAAVPLATLADYRVFVLRPEKSSLEGAYALAKTMLWRAFRATAIQRDALTALEEAEARSPGGKVPALLRQVRERDPALAGAMQACTKRLRCGLLGNQTRNLRDANVLYACARVIKDFLRIPVEVLGQVYYDPALTTPQRAPLGARSSRGSDVGVLMGVVRTVREQAERGADSARGEWIALLPAMNALSPAGASQQAPADSRAAPAPEGGTERPKGARDDPAPAGADEAVSAQPEVIDSDPLGGIQFEAVSAAPPEGTDSDPLGGIQFEAVSAAPPEGTDSDPLGGIQFEAVSASPEGTDSDPLGGIQFEAVSTPSEDTDPASPDPASTSVGDDAALLSADELSADLDGYGRRHDRVPLDTAAQVSVNGEAPVPCRSVDVSESGLSVHGPEGLHPNDHLLVDYPELEGAPQLRATVRYVGQDGKVGAELVFASRAVAASIVARLRPGTTLAAS